MPFDPTHRTAGILVPVFALRHAEDLGIGDTLAMRDAIDFCADNGLGILQVLPINETGGDHSPYNAISSVALAPELLSVQPGDIPGLTEEVYNTLAPETIRQELREGAVDYPRVKALKLDLLAAAFAEFESSEIENETDLAKDFESFIRDNKAWLPGYTLFRALVNEYEGNACWVQWKVEHQSLPSALEWLEKCENSDELERFRDFCAFVQWIAFKQWHTVRAYATSRHVRLMGDMPFGVSRYGADVWANRELFDLTWSGGAPKEPFFESDLFTRRWGQNWGIPLYKWDVHREQNFAWWRQRVSLLLQCFHDFRIDHVLGFFRIYAFPWLPKDNHMFVDLTPDQAKEAAGGRLPQFIPEPDEPAAFAEANEKLGAELLRMILDAAGNGGVVAEDLGAVPKYVRPVLKELGIPGFMIPTFERISDTERDLQPSDTYPALGLTTYATHDHPPIITAYDEMVKRWHGPEGHEGWLEMQRLMRWLQLDDKNPPKVWSEELHRVFMQRLFETPCCMAVLMITDLLGTTQRFNMPGSCGEFNWSQRLDMPLAGYAVDPVYGPRIHAARELMEKTGRRQG